MAKPATRIAFLQAALAAAAALVLVRSAKVQVIEHDKWATVAKQLRQVSQAAPARRGAIYDRNGVPLAITMEKYHVEIAPDQVRDTAAVVRRVSKAIGVRADDLAARIRAGRYIYYHGPFRANDVLSIRGLVGVTFPRMAVRSFPQEMLARGLIGRLRPDTNRGADGVERGFDSLLAGTPGQLTLMRDAKGRLIEGPNAVVRRPVAGHDLYLTIDRDLQSIAEAALRRALTEFRAEAGDIVVMDVHTGELYAVASLRTDAAGQVEATASAFVEPYEPGSTAKIFTAGAAVRSAPDTNPQSGKGGTWVITSGRGTRTINDTHREDGLLTLGQTIKYSSNIAIAQFALTLTPEQHFTALRDFGFGVATTTHFPGEAGGYLNRPANWVNAVFSQTSLAQGYEFSATAIQIAAAYAAIANGGTLLMPALLREARAGETPTVVWRHRVDTVRTAVPPAIAGRLLEYLTLATDSAGTGTRAQLDRSSVIGKTGTAKLLIDGHYRGEYRASFAGLYPGDRPQVVIYVMINRPRVGSYYGGLVAAPIVRSILQQALSIRTTPLDRRHVAAEVLPRATTPRRSIGPSTRMITVALHGPAPGTVGGAMVEVGLVTGMTLRTASNALHSQGLHVKAIGRGTVRRTAPEAGGSIPRGSTVTVYADITP